MSIISKNSIILTAINSSSLKLDLFYGKSVDTASVQSTNGCAIAQFTLLLPELNLLETERTIQLLQLLKAIRNL